LGLAFILIALAVTPLRRLTGWNALARVRRMLGLFAFSYVVLHLLVYIGVDQLFDAAAIWKEILKRKFITVGMFAFLMLLPLAITSTDAMVRRLGGRAWRRLHMLVFPAAIAGVIHYVMMIKAGLMQPAIYGAILAALLLARVVPRRT
jgi:sulfoxide reductase heme-binding subunit YedZ